MQAKLDEGINCLIWTAVLHCIGHHSIPSDDVSLRHSIEKETGVSLEACFVVHIEGAACNEDVVNESRLEGRGMNLLSTERLTNGGSCFEGGWKGEVVGTDGGAKHSSEVGERREGAAVLCSSRDDSGPGDDGGGRVEG